MQQQKQIVYNSVTCTECGTKLVSRTTHDYKTCDCPNNAMVDGGHHYGRYGAVDISKIKVFTLFEDDPIELIREHVERGGRGINGDEPLTWVKLKDVNDEWLEALLLYCPSGGWYWNIVNREKKYRETLCQK
jgi:hypothetical protein